MVKKNNAAATPHNSASGGTLVREFLNGEFPPETPRQRVAIFLTGKDLVRNMKLAPEDQTKFLDKVDRCTKVNNPYFVKFPFTSLTLPDMH